tara:strand:+ start:776 stop:2296 length:1521 start_codon:yes stop_codon:yes gene_type:complete
MDELKKLFEAIASEKTRNLKLEEEKVLKQVEKTQKRIAHKDQVKEDFWGVFKSELKKLSEQEEETSDKLGRLKEIKEQFEEATPHLYKEEVEVETPQSTPDFFANIDPQKMANEFDIRPVSQMTEDMSTQSGPYELKDHPTTLIEMPEEDRTGILDPDISILETKVNALEKKYAGVVEEEVIQEEADPSSFNVSKDAYSAVMDVLSLKPVEKKDKEERKLQELAVQYLSEKKQIVKEQVDETANVQKQIADINANVRQLILGMQGIGGGGEVRLERLDDVDRSSATTDGRFLRYSSSTKKWEGVAIDTGDQAAILDNSGTPALATGVTASEIRTLIDAQQSGSYVTLSGLSVGSEASASGDGGISYNNSTGVFTYTPPDLSAKADLASPALTGNPTAPTQSASDNSTKIATTAYADTAVANIVDSSPAALNTLNELAAALGDDENFSTTVTNSIATKAPLASPALTGTPTAPTASTGTNTTQVATTAFVKAEIDALKALLYAYDQS